MPVLPSFATTTRLSRIPLASSGALQYWRRCLRPLGGARARPARHSACAAGRRATTPSATAGCARPPTGSPMCCARMASRAATASRSCCRRRRKWRPAISRIYKLGAVALPLAILFGVDALSYRLQNSGAQALITNAQGLAKLAEIRDELPELELRAVDRRRRRRRAGFYETLSRAHRPISRQSIPRPTIRR